MKVNAYLNFNGNCEDAFKFYEKAIGAKIEALGRFGDSPAAEQVPPEWRQKIMHAWLTVGGTVLMGSDAPHDRYEQPKGLWITLTADSPVQAEGVFHALSEKGEVGIPLAQTFFAQRFGMVTDRFGIPWMVMCQNA